MAASLELTTRVRAALEAGESTSLPELQALYQECFHEPCRRRNRITYKLTRFLQQQAVAEPAGSATALSTVIMGKSENFRFKSAFKGKKAIVHTPTTRYVTADSLTDEDIVPLREAGVGHFVESVPGREKEGEAALAKLAEPAEQEPAELPSLNVNKAELQAIYANELGKPADTGLNKDELKEAIEAHRNTAK